MFDFYDDWDDDEAVDLFGPIRPSGGAKGKKSRTVGAGGGGIDEEDRRFFEELAKGFSAKEEQNIDEDMNENV